MQSYKVTRSEFFSWELLIMAIDMPGEICFNPWSLSSKLEAKRHALSCLWRLLCFSGSYFYPMLQQWQSVIIFTCSLQGIIVLILPWYLVSPHCWNLQSKYYYIVTRGYTDYFQSRKFPLQISQLPVNQYAKHLVKSLNGFV